MRSFTFEELDPTEFDAFSATHPQGNFQQTSSMGKVRQAEGVEVSYLGVREGDRLVAATQLEVHRSRMSTFAEVHDGPLCDLGDAELTAYLFDQLRQRAKAAGCAQLEVTPELPYQVRASNGSPLPQPGTDQSWPQGVPAGAPIGPQRAAFDNVVAAGFQHSGFDRTYNAVPRWRYLKDLAGITDEQTLLASYTKNTRRDIKIAADSYVTVERIGRDDLPTYHAICELSAEKQGFENRPLSYFQLLYDALGDKADFIVAYIDMPAFLAEWEAKSDALAQKIARLEGKVAAAADGGNDAVQGQFRSAHKAERQLADAREKYEGAIKRVESSKRAIAEQGERVPAAAALFVWHPRECVYLFSGSDQRHATFCAPTAIQHRMLCECLRRGVTRYNFYGINGVFDDPQDPGRGLLEFKQGFGGYVEEMMGSFTLPVRPAAYALKQMAHKVLGR